MRFGRRSAITCVARMCASSVRAAAEGERAEAADGAGMAVGNGVGRARQHHAELRRDDVGDALLRVIDVEKPDGVAAAALAHRLEKRRARWVGAVVAARLGGDGVILHREGEVRPAHRPLLLLQLLEGVGRVQLVQHVPVDVDQIAAVGAARHQMRVPDLVEQGGGHGGDTSGSACGTEEARGHSWARPGTQDRWRDAGAPNDEASSPAAPGTRRESILGGKRYTPDVIRG